MLYFLLFFFYPFACAYSDDDAALVDQIISGTLDVELLKSQIDEVRFKNIRAKTLVTADLIDAIDNIEHKKGTHQTIKNLLQLGACSDSSTPSGIMQCIML